MRRTRTPLSRKSPLRSRSEKHRPVYAEAPRPQLDLEQARVALTRRAESAAAPRGEHTPAPKPEHVAKPKASGFSQVVRQTILDRDHMACARCGVPIESSSVGYSLQHRNARGMGGTSDPRINMAANGVVLCGSATTGCHGWVEDTDPTEAERQGLAVQAWADPETVPMLTMRDGWVRIDNNGGRWQVPTPPDGDAHGVAQRLGAMK